MYIRNDGKLLKTKIVATLGAPRDGIFNHKGQFIREFENADNFWNIFLDWFFQKSMYLIDVLRLNMAFFSPPGDNERRILGWLRNNKEKVKNVVLLGDLPGPKVRLRNVQKPIQLFQGRKQKLLFRVRKPEDGPSICVYGQPLGQVDQNLAGTIERFLSQGVQPIVSIGDGKVSLKVSEISGDALICVVEKAGSIEEGQGLTFKGLPLDLPSFQKEDKEALDFLIEEGFDWNEDLTDPNSLRSFLGFVGVSFVKNSQDILDVKSYVEQKVFNMLKEVMPSREKEELIKEASLLSPDIIAKIETKQARDNIDEILDVADGAMVARGDLALALGPQEVPTFAKHLIRLCNLRGKPVITATEMLASMEQNPEPTRAEANDVFNAILDGSDAVMLSGETSKGKYPFQAVKMMVKIAEAAEKHLENFGRQAEIKTSERRRLNEQRFQELLVGSESIVEENTRRLENKFLDAAKQRDPWLENFYREKWERSRKQGITDSISMAACLLSNSSDEYKAILAPTTSTRTARMISRFRPNVNVIGAAHDSINQRKMMLNFGVYPINCGRLSDTTGQQFKNTEEIFLKASEVAKNEGYLRKGDTVIFIAGTPLFKPGTTNLIQIKEVE